MSNHSHTHSHNCSHNHNHGGSMSNLPSQPQQNAGTSHMSGVHHSAAALKGMTVDQFTKLRQGMMLTSCLVCGRKLWDTQSVTEGIGPDCAHKYGYTLNIPSATQVQKALGILALLPISQDKGFMDFLLANTGDTRKFSNILVAWCSHLVSTHQDEKVFDYTGAFEALGLDLVADRITLSRCTLRTIKQAENGQNYWAFHFPANANVKSNLRRYGLDVRHRKVNVDGMLGGNKYRLDTQAELDLMLWVCAGEFSGQRLYNCGTVVTIPAQSALPVPPAVTAYRARYKKPVAQPSVPSVPTPSQIGLRISKHTSQYGTYFRVTIPPFWNLKHWKPVRDDQKPFWRAFLDDVKASTRARWNNNTKTWKVDGSKETDLVNAINRHLGYTKSDLGL